MEFPRAALVTRNADGSRSAGEQPADAEVGHERGYVVVAHRSPALVPLLGPAAHAHQTLRGDTRANRLRYPPLALQIADRRSEQFDVLALLVKNPAQVLWLEAGFFPKAHSKQRYIPHHHECVLSEHPAEPHFRI